MFDTNRNVKYVTKKRDNWKHELRKNESTRQILDKQYLSVSFGEAKHTLMYTTMCDMLIIQNRFNSFRKEAILNLKG